MAAKEETGRKGISEPPSPLPRQVTNPIDILAHDHSRQEWLCDVLETIADGLPGKLECALAAMVAEALKIDVPLHHENEELGLFPLLSRRAAVADNIDAVIRQLNREHMADDTYANDLIDLLEALASGRVPANPEMAGYMIRGFFESYRRHIAFENMVVLPLARVRLTDGDMADLLTHIQASRRRMAGSRN